MSGAVIPTQFWRSLSPLSPGQETLWDNGSTVWDWDVVLNETHWDQTSQTWTPITETGVQGT